MRVLLAGGTGLVGSEALRCLVERGHTVTALGRRATGAATEDLVVDFAALPTLPDADAAVCALGTTRAAAGSREAMRAVDVDAVIAFAKAAHAAGARHCVLVTAVGADARSPVAYTRMKGEVEEAVAALGFERLDILQPGLLIGARSERRSVEAFFQAVSPVLDRLLLPAFDRYGSIRGSDVGAAAVALLEQGGGGVHRHENRALRALAEGG
jgi:uncharacterized protein YbjT (DUF2867 family)